MKTRAVRLYGSKDLRCEQFELPQLEAEELLVRIVVAAVCTSCHKVAVLGEHHHRVPNTIAQNPILLGHEFTAVIVAVGEGLENQFAQGDSVVVQPMVYSATEESLAVGHSYPYLGGYATYGIVPASIVTAGGVHRWEGKGHYRAALSEPLACIIAAWRAQYHTGRESYKPIHGTKRGGKTLLLAGAGSMGFLSTLLWQKRADQDSTLIIVDRNEIKLNRLRERFAEDQRIVHYKINEISADFLREKTGGLGFDDVVVFAPSKELISLGLSLLAFDGCLNMFAGPLGNEFTVPVDFHAVHYNRHHIVGSSGASGEDLGSSLKLLASESIDPSFMVTHVGGLDSVAATVCNLPSLGGGKKLIYPELDLPLTSISEFSNLEGYKSVADAIERFGGVWNEEAELELLKRLSDTTMQRRNEKSMQRE